MMHGQVSERTTRMANPRGETEYGHRDLGMIEQNYTEKAALISGRQVQVMSTLPLKAISRLWGRFNELEIPYYLRVPGFKLYSYIFGVKYVLRLPTFSKDWAKYLPVFPKYQNLIFMYTQISLLSSIEL